MGSNVFPGLQSQHQLHVLSNIIHVWTKPTNPTCNHRVPSGSISAEACTGSMPAGMIQSMCCRRTASLVQPCQFVCTAIPCLTGQSGSAGDSTGRSSFHCVPVQCRVAYNTTCTCLHRKYRTLLQVRCWALAVIAVTCYWPETPPTCCQKADLAHHHSLSLWKSECPQ